MEPALDLGGAGPATVRATARRGAVGAADRGVAAVVQRVVGDVVLADVAPDVLLAPVRERSALELARMPAVGAQLRCVRAGRRLLAPQAGDPGVDPAQRPLERLGLAHAAAGVRVAVPQAV